MGATYRRILFATLLAGISLAGSHAWALDPQRLPSQYAMRTWNAEDGLPNNFVEQLVQGKDGYIWVATQHGLSRFDGVRFSLPLPLQEAEWTQGWINTVYADAKGGQWFGTRSHGLFHYYNGQVQQYSWGLDNSLIAVIRMDSRGHLWVASQNKLYFIAKPYEGNAAQARPVLDGEIINLLFQQDKVLAGIQTGEIWQLSLNGQTRKRLAQPSKTQLREMLYCQKTLWIGTGKGLRRTLDKKPLAPNAPQELSDTGILALVCDRDGALWVGTLGAGIFRLYNGEWTALNEKNSELSSNIIIDVYEGYDGSLWVGTSGGGISQLYAPSLYLFTQQQGLSSNSISGIYEENNGELQVGFVDAGINTVNNWQVINRLNTGNILQSNQIASVTRDNSGNLWVASYNNGLLRIAPDKAANNGRRLFTTADGLPSNLVFTLLRGKDDGLWIGTSAGLAYWNGQQISNLTAAHSKQDTDFFVTNMTPDGNEGIWLGTYDNGLKHFSNGELTTVNLGQKIDNALILELMLDNNKGLWFSVSDHGLFHLADGKLTNMTPVVEKFASDIYRILQDKQQNIWLCSGSGLQMITPQEQTVLIENPATDVPLHTWGRLDGYPSNECVSGAYPSDQQLQSGTLVFPTYSGILIARPSLLLNRQTNAPQTMIEYMQAHERQIAVGDEPLSLHAGFNNVMFKYTAIEFNAPEAIEFRYRLVGFDEEWVHAGQRRQAFYTNLPPDDYRFLVQARNGRGGEWTDAKSPVTFSIEPYFYQTNLFYVILIILIIIIAYGLHYARSAHLHRLTKYLQVKVEQRTEKLRQANRELAKLATTDNLTQLANREHFFDVLNNEWARAGRSGNPLSLLMIDIDCFKLYNDNYGYLAGNACLQVVASVLNNCSRRVIDLAAHYGGDEFVILLPETPLHGAHHVAELIRNGIAANPIPHQHSPIQSSVTLSIGIASMVPPPNPSQRPEILIAQADKNLYAAKQQGGNRISS